MPHDHHDHSHHAHSHHGSADSSLARAGIVNLLWAVAQAVAGIALGSTALLSDSVHNLGDAVGLVLAWGAAGLAAKAATSHRTWGWHRAELLAGFVNAVLVVVGAVLVFGGAIWRLFHPTPIEGLVVSGWALGGIVVNLLSAWWIGGHSGNLNNRGAFLHLISDALVSGAVVLGGLAVFFTGRAWIDPALAVAVSLWLLKTTWPFLRETFDALLDAVPARQDLSQIKNDLTAIDGVTALHDLHVWSLGGERVALSVHLVHGDSTAAASVLEKALDVLHHGYPDIHATIQVEPEEGKHWHGHAVCHGRE